jgi:Plasmid pRiA4b ORF-3-like protein
LRIQLENVTPRIWRLVLVPGSVSLGKLSSMLCAAMGWTDSHLHGIRVADRYYTTLSEDSDEDELDEDEVTVLEALGDERRFFYDYDFGDDWVHELEVEELDWSSSELKFALCLEGENACPPEDVGGTSGYAHFLEAITNPEHEEHDSYLEWVGGSFDPSAFDLGVANARCQTIR